MVIEMDITEEQANEILLALSYRCKQDGIRNNDKQDEIEVLGKQLSRRFESMFNWKTTNNKPLRVFEYYLKKNVTVRVRGK